MTDEQIEIVIHRISLLRHLPDLCDLIGVVDRTIRRWINAGVFPKKCFIKRGGAYDIEEHGELASWLCTHCADRKIAKYIRRILDKDREIKKQEELARIEQQKFVERLNLKRVPHTPYMKQL